jgi:hypothetical protein
MLQLPYYLTFVNFQEAMLAEPSSLGTEPRGLSDLLRGTGSHTRGQLQATAGGHRHGREE